VRSDRRGASRSDPGRGRQLTHPVSCVEESAGEFRGARGWERKAFNVRRVECKPSLPRLGGNPSSDPAASLVVAYLPEPEASDRTVQRPQESKMLSLPSRVRQRDDRSRILENGPLLIVNEVVVRCNFRERDAQPILELVDVELLPLVPGEAALNHR